MKRTAMLPYGFTAVFSYSDGKFGCDWQPEVPASSMRTARARRKLVAAYTVERNSFIKDIATIRQEAIIIADLDGGSLTHSIIEPETIQ